MLLLSLTALGTNVDIPQSYPVVYIVTVSPIAVVRWMAFSHQNVPFAATAFASILFSSSGLFNVILYRFTRPKLMPHRDPSISWRFPSTNTRSFRHDSGAPSHLPRPFSDDMRIDEWKVARRPFLQDVAKPERPPIVYISPTPSRPSI